jgi:RNA polymerase sigma-70 factor (ECF subfamily)
MTDDISRKMQALARRIDAGDMDALEETYDVYAAAVYRQALAILGAPSDAEDALQEVFLKLVKRRGGEIRDLRSYLLTAARHEAYTLLRRRKRESVGYEADVALSEEPGRSRSFLEAEIARNALLRLPPEQREVVNLKVYEQMTFQEIARIVKASANTVASRYRYAMKKLREALGDAAHV